MTCSENGSLTPPAYVNVPVSIAYANMGEVCSSDSARLSDAVIVTMTRLLGLCWQHDYRRTPALTPDELAAAVGRSRSALYRHLKVLKDDDEGGQNPDCLGWLHVEKRGRRVIIRPLVGVPASSQAMLSGTQATPDGAQALGSQDHPFPAGADGELVQALEEIGVENPKRGELARQAIDPTWVYAWDLWTKHLHRRSLENPVGCVIRKLEQGERPPAGHLREAEQLLAHKVWEQKQATCVPVAEAELTAESELVETRFGTSPQSAVSLEVQTLWQAALGDLQLQMTRATFDAWLRGSRVVEGNVEGDAPYLTIYVRRVHAVDWLQARLKGVIDRTVRQRAGREVAVSFTAAL